MSQYDIINIYDNVKAPFQMVLENGKDDEIRLTRNYKTVETKFINSIIELYSPNIKSWILDYNKTNCYFSLMLNQQGFNTLYINKNTNNNKFIKMSSIINNSSNLYILNKPSLINTIVKNEYILLLIIDDIVLSLSSKRLLNKGSIPHIIIFRDHEDYETEYIIYRILFDKLYVFYNIMTGLKIGDIWEFIKSDKTSSIACIHNNSKFRSEFTVSFD